MKAYIINSIRNILGITALEAEVKALTEKNKALQDELEANYVTERDLSQCINGLDFVTDGELQRAVSDELDNTDWDNVVSDALGERQTSAALDEAISNSIQSALEERGAKDSIVEAIVDAIQDDNDELIDVIADALKNRELEMEVNCHAEEERQAASSKQ